MIKSFFFFFFFENMIKSFLKYITYEEFWKYPKKPKENEEFSLQFLGTEQAPLRTVMVCVHFMI